jgi:hypothetical protein
MIEYYYTIKQQPEKYVLAKDLLKSTLDLLSMEFLDERLHYHKQKEQIPTSTMKLNTTSMNSTNNTIQIEWILNFNLLSRFISFHKAKDIDAGLMYNMVHFPICSFYTSGSLTDPVKTAVHGKHYMHNVKRLLSKTEFKHSTNDIYYIKPGFHPNGSSLDHGPIFEKVKHIYN